MKFKRFLSAVVACIMLIAVAVPFAAFADEPVLVQGGGTETTPGGEAVVHISITGAKIGAFALTVNFDASKLQYIGCTASEEFQAILDEVGGIYLVNDNDADTGKLVIGGAITEGATFTVAPISLTFKAAEVDETTNTEIAITVDRLRTELDAALNSQVQNGGVQITVKHITSIVFTDESKDLNIGDTYTPEFTVNPADYTDTFAPVWSSDNDEVASVDENGQITAIREGVANITITNGNISATIAINVKPAYRKGDLDEDGEITVGDALKALRIAAKLVEPTPKELLIGNVDGDDDITVGDALMILRVAAKLVSEDSFI